MFNLYVFIIIYQYFTGAVRDCWYDVEYSSCMSQLYAHRAFPIRAVVVVNK